MKNMHNDNLEPLSTDLEALRNLRLQSFINQVRKMLLIPTYAEDKAISKQFVISTDTAGCVHTGSKKGTWVCGRHASRESLAITKAAGPVNCQSACAVSLQQALRCLLVLLHCLGVFHRQTVLNMQVKYPFWGACAGRCLSGYHCCFLTKM